MTTATELAMNLADVKLRLRQLAAPHKSKHISFDTAVEAAIRNLNRAIVESVEAVRKSEGLLTPRMRPRPKVKAPVLS